jgi:hypothetical protein
MASQGTYQCLGERMDVCMKCLYFYLKVEESIVGFSVHLAFISTSLGNPGREFCGEA